jgi:flagellar hook-associated protein 3 FlgL
MRVTEHRLIQLASQATSKARENAAKAGTALTTGVAVDRPSVDPGKWAEAKAAAARSSVSEGRGRAIADARGRLNDADGAFDSMGEMMRRVQELSVQASTGTMSEAERSSAATEIRGLRDAIRAIGNQQGDDGEYVLGGASGAPPFDAGGAYVGTDDGRRVEVGENQFEIGSVTGAVLTASHGVDVFGTLDALVSALDANDPAAVRGQLSALETGINQIGSARTEVGIRMGALDLAENARAGFNQRLTETIDRAIAADPVAAAGELAEAAQALEAARAAAQKMVELAGA